ncbi:unnamed protein product [Camellia sinensis]
MLSMENNPKRDEEAKAAAAAAMVMHDRIPQLPDSIVHNILSLLPPKDAARTSILSKACHHLYSTSPFLAFEVGFKNPDYIITPNEYKEKLDLVDKCLQRHLLQNPNMRAFKMSISFPYTKSLATCLHKWVTIALARNIDELNLDVTSTTQFYILPMSVPIANTLKVVSLSYCKLQNNCLGKLPQLQKLSLHRVYIEEDNQFFENLDFHCPSIEDLKLSLCQGLNRLHLGSTLLRLKNVHLDAAFDLKSIEIKAPNIHRFSFCGQGFSSFQHNLSACTVLQTLELRETLITDQAFQELMTQLPSLEVLGLHSCSILNRIKISSPKLSRLVVHQCLGLSVTELDTPNLLSIHYAGYKMPFIFMNTPHLRNVDIEFWLQSLQLSNLDKLKNFLLQSSHSKDFKLVMFYHHNSKPIFIQKKLSDNLSPLYHLKDFNPIVYITSRTNADFIQYLCEVQSDSLICALT